MTQEAQLAEARVDRAVRMLKLAWSAKPPKGKRHPITSVESQTYIDTGEWPDAATNE